MTMQAPAPAGSNGMNSSSSSRGPKLDLVAPGMTARHWNEAEVLGATVWLWMHSPAHRDLPVHKVPGLLLPAIERRQFVLGSQAGKPLFYMSWAKFDAQAEQRYIQNQFTVAADDDWNSGNRLWIVDWIAPFGHTPTLARIVRRRLFRQWMGRMLYHRSDPRRPRIMTFRGSATSSEEAEIWFEANPVWSATQGRRGGRGK